MTHSDDQARHPGDATLNLVQDVGPDGPLQLQPDERLWRLYIIRPASGRATRLEHRIYSKLKPDGRLAMVTFAVDTPRPGRAVRSGIARVPDLTAEALEQIIEAVRRQTQTGEDEYIELDLSHLATLTEQMAYLREFEGGRQGRNT